MNKSDQNGKGHKETVAAVLHQRLTDQKTHFML